jgi:hypothetical protein
VLDLATRVEVEPDEWLAPLDARVEIETTAGERLVSRWRGEDASYAWPWAKIVAWARALGAELGEPYLRTIERVAEAVERIDQDAGVTALTAATVVER